MSTFQFRLDRVLEWYRTQLQLDENHLAACLAALNLVQERIARLSAERLAVESETVAGGSILARDLSSLGFYRIRVKKEEAALDEERARRERAAADQRARVQAAQRRVRLVEKLRARRLSEYDYAENRALECVAAEAYLSKWIAAKVTASEPALRK
jgi:flagellar export protein FliJ